MATTAYVVLKTRSSPVAIGYTTAHEVWLSRKDAIDRCRDLNAKSQRNSYDVVRVPLGGVWIKAE